MNGPFTWGEYGPASSSLEVNISSGTPNLLTPGDEDMIQHYSLMCDDAENKLKEQYGADNVIDVEHIDPDTFINNCFHGENNNGNTDELKINDPELIELVEDIKKVDIIAIAKVPDGYLGDLRMIDNGERWPVAGVFGVVNHNGAHQVNLGVCDENGQYLDCDEYNTWESLYAANGRWSDSIMKLILQFILDNNTFFL